MKISVIMSKMIAATRAHGVRKSVGRPVVWKLSGWMLVGGWLGVATSCSGFLGEDPHDGLDEGQAFGDLPSLFHNAVATLYNNVGGYEDSKGLQGTCKGIYDLNTFTTDEAMMPTRGGDWYDGGLWQGLFLHDWGVNNDAILNTWDYLFSSILLCNHSLEEIGRFEAVHPEAEEILQTYRAEVRALRAMFYFYTMDLFGRIPLITAAGAAGQEMTQVERSRLFTFLVKELQEAAPLLSKERSNTPGEYYGRMTQSVAYFLLAKLMLNAEVYLDDDWTDGVYPDGKQLRFTVEGKTMNAWEAVVYYGGLITEAGYRLEPDYTANFAVFNERSAENIFVIPMNKTLYTNQMQYLFRSRHYNHAKAYGLGGENGSSATWEALETFGYGTAGVDPRFEYCYFSDAVFDLQGNPVLLDDGTPLVYYPQQVALDVSGTEYEKTAGARMKKYGWRSLDGQP